LPEACFHLEVPVLEEERLFSFPPQLLANDAGLLVLSMPLGLQPIFQILKLL
jgi:hypothetical protein